MGDMLSVLEDNTTVAQILHSPILQFALTIILIMTAGSWFVLLRTEHGAGTGGGANVVAPVDESDIRGKMLQSADNQKTITIDGNGAAKYITEGKINAGPTLLLNADLSDAFRLIPGSLFHKEIWLRRADDGLVDDSNSKLYSPKSPERNVIDKMLKFAEAAQERYRKKGSYPIDGQQLSSFTGYINPYTSKGDAPFYSAMYVPDKRGMNQKLEDQASKGEAFINEPMLHEGAINCCVLVLNKPDKANERGSEPVRITSGYAPPVQQASQSSPSVGASFFIRGVARDRHYIQGNNGSVFYISLDEGKSEILDKIKKPSEPSETDSSTRIIITPDAGEHEFYKFIRQILPAIVALVAVLAGVAWRGLKSKKDAESQEQRRIALIVVIASTALLGIWFLICAIG
jgi:hypothetical protein